MLKNNRPNNLIKESISSNITITVNYYEFKIIKWQDSAQLPLGSFTGLNYLDRVDERPGNVN